MNLHRPKTGNQEASDCTGGFSIELAPTDWPAALIVAQGELDLAAVPALRVRLTAVEAVGARSLILDLNDVSFIDSLSLAAIVAAKRRLGPSGRLAIVASHPYVLLILEAGGLDAVVDVFLTREDAAAHLFG